MSTNRGRRMRGVISAVLLVALDMIGAGCTSTSGNDFSTAGAAQIRSGVTDKATVIRYLGQPYQRAIDPSGDETWTYSFSQVGISPTATFFIPFVGPQLANSARSTVDTRMVTISFKADIVASCHLYVSNNAATGAGIAGGGAYQAASGGGSGTSQTTNCGDSAPP